MKKQLRLRRETVRVLELPRLAAVHGGTIVSLEPPIIPPSPNPPNLPDTPPPGTGTFGVTTKFTKL